MFFFSGGEPAIWVGKEWLKNEPTRGKITGGIGAEDGQDAGSEVFFKRLGGPGGSALKSISHP